jgi:hypothetical protein
MKKRLIILFCFISILSFGQKSKSTALSEISLGELSFKVYDKDSTANAVVLYEHGNLYVNPNRKFNFTTDYYFRVKILKKEGFEKATVKIPIYDKEVVHDIKAITYNLSGGSKVVKTHLLKDKIYTKQTSEKWKEVSFTLSNIKVGSVIEYKYSVTSPYKQIDDWNFQSDIPKVKSDFTAAILGNWQYNVRMVGYLKLNRDNPSVKKGCVYVPGIGNGACSILDFGMDFIPAFKEENYMLSKKNYSSKVVFDLKSYTNVKGEVTNYTKTWKSADKRLRYNFLDNQTSKKKYFRKNILNDSILSIQDELVKAKRIYTLINEHYTWNDKYWPSKKVKIKKAFEKKLGNVFDINLSLYNALQAAGIESKLVLLATRGKGIPTKLYPIDTDFNYVVVKTVIDNKTYFLDAVDSNLPFGLIQFEALNGDGRVMDFKEGSFWEPISLSQKTTKKTRLSLKLTEESLSGNLLIDRAGYNALDRRISLKGQSNDDVLSDFETNNPDIEAESIQIKNLNNSEKNLKEIYKVNIETDFIEGSTKIRINPFLIDKVTVNPFKLNERDYPVNYGYARASVYMMSLAVPKEYKISKLPEKIALSLPNKGGVLILNVKQKENVISLYLKFTINKSIYTNNEYFYLKQFYQKLIDTQNTFIELEKI